MSTSIGILLDDVLNFCVFPLLPLPSLLCASLLSKKIHKIITTIINAQREKLPPPFRIHVMRALFSEGSTTERLLYFNKTFGYEILPSYTSGYRHLFVDLECLRAAALGMKIILNQL